jgi:hypothetical protein
MLPVYSDSTMNDLEDAEVNLISTAKFKPCLKLFLR